MPQRNSQSAFTRPASLRTPLPKPPTICFPLMPILLRSQFDATRAPHGALIVGDPEALAEKILYENEVLGGISRVTLLLTPGTISHSKVMHAIELLGTRVRPMVNKELVAVP
jgi:hypothetical protein